MPTDKLVFMLLIIGGLVATYIMSPRQQELALMHLKEGHLDSAEYLYQGMRPQASIRRENLFPLVQVYLEKGEISAAISVYENYIKKHPDDREVLIELGKLYKSAHRDYSYMRLLEVLASENPGLAKLEELYALYVKYGERRSAVATLNRLIEYAPDRYDLHQQLITLQAFLGDYAAAETSLAHYFQANHPLPPGYAEMRLRLLLRLNRFKAASDWAHTWLAEYPEAALRFIALLYSGGKTDAFGDALSLMPQHLQEMPQWLLERLVEAAWNSREIKLLHQLRPHLSERTKNKLPVIMATLALEADDRVALDGWLEKAVHSPSLPPGHQIALAEIYIRTEQLEKARQVLLSPSNLSSVPGHLVVRLIEMMLNAGQVDQSAKVFEQLQRFASDDEWHYAQLLIHVAQGSEDVKNKLPDTNLEREQLKNLYYVAAGREHQALAYVIARHLHARHPGPDETELLAHALLRLDKAHDAVGILKPYKKHAPKLGRLYEQAVTQAWKTSPQLSDEMAAIWQTRLKSGRLGVKTRRAVAFQLLDAGKKQEAIEVFKGLAASQGPDGKDVEQLLYLWGAAPAADALDWVEQRAMRAPAAELSGWWNHLVQMGGVRRILVMVDKLDGHLPASAEVVLVNALLSIGDTQSLEVYLYRQLHKPLDTTRLEKLAVSAQHANLSEVVIEIWTRIVKQEPRNLKANKALGLLAFAQGDHQVAETYLTTYLRQSESDWECLFYLGEILQAQGHQKRARGYFERSLAVLSGVEQPSKHMRATRALLHYRLSHFQQAMQEFDTLIDEFPADLQLRADYSALLIEQGRLDQAQRLLNGT